MPDTTSTTGLKEFLDDVLNAHKSFGNIVRPYHQHEMELPTDVRDIGAVLDALNALAQIKLDAFAVQAEEAVGEFIIEQSCDCSTVLGVSLIYPEMGLSGKIRTDTRERNKAFIRECLNSAVSTRDKEEASPTAACASKNEPPVFEPISRWWY